MAEWIFISERTPESYGYYIAVWNDEGNWRVSELWYDPGTKGSGWWATRGYMSRFTGEGTQKIEKRSLTVVAWMPTPEFPGLGRTIAYKIDDRIYPPEEVTIVREPFAPPSD